MENRRLEAEAKEWKLAHDKELELARSTMAKRGQEQQGDPGQLGRDCSHLPYWPLV